MPSSLLGFAEIARGRISLEPTGLVARYLGQTSIPFGKGGIMRKILILLALVFWGSICLCQEVISWRDAAKYYGQQKTIEGNIVVTRNTGKACFLNFSENWKTDFTAVIFASDFPKFPPNPETYYKGKRVRVTGRVQEYQGKPEIILRTASQVVLVAEKYGYRPTRL
jgi:micrococcal nuclease